MLNKCLPLCLLIVLILSLTAPALAQDQTTVLSLTTPTTELQTGQEYEIAIQIDGAPEVWSMNLEIGYDPAAIYVLGTRSGAPVRQGDFLAPNTSTVEARNLIRNNRVIYTLSMIAPAEPVSGSGTVGIFRVYPLAPGTTTLVFSQAEVTNIRRITAADGSESIVTDQIPFAPVLLNLNITGDPVEAPEEIEATITPTSAPVSGNEAQIQPTARPTLENVTLAPTQPVATTTPAAESEGGTSPLLIVAIVVLVLSGLGLAGIIVVWSRRR